MYLFKLDIACTSVKCLSVKSVCCDVITLQHYLLPGSTNHNNHIIFWETDTTGGSGLPFKLCGCWCVCSLLAQPPLFHLLLLISMETGLGVFSHICTLAINQQVRLRSIPTHTHHMEENKEHTHGDTEPNHRNIPEPIQYITTPLSRSYPAAHISVYQSRQPIQ